MHKVPHLQERLASLLYKLNFNVKLEEIRPEIRNIKIACQELRRSDKMVKMLELILYLGNFLNAGTFRGNMDGVKMDMLPKVRLLSLYDGPFEYCCYASSLLSKKNYQAFRRNPSTCRSLITNATRVVD
jgi:hypothetical protein